MTKTPIAAHEAEIDHPDEPAPPGNALMDVAHEATGSTSKIAKVLGLLGSEQGATLNELAQATSWLPHTVRAALTGLRKKGHVIERGKRGAVTYYQIKGAA